MYVVEVFGDGGWRRVEGVHWDRMGAWKAAALQRVRPYRIVGVESVEGIEVLAGPASPGEGDRLLSQSLRSENVPVYRRGDRYG